MMVTPLDSGCNRSHSGYQGEGRVEQRPSPWDLFRLSHPQDLLARHGSDHVRMLVLDVLLDVADELVVGLAAHGLAARAVDLHRHCSSSRGRTGKTRPRWP